MPPPHSKYPEIDRLQRVVAAQREALEEADTLADAATPGPWYFDGRDIFAEKIREDGHRLVLPLPEPWTDAASVDADARFVVALVNGYWRARAALDAEGVSEPGKQAGEKIGAAPLAEEAAPGSLTSPVDTARHPCMRCGSEEWTDVDYSGCSDCREPADAEEVSEPAANTLAETGATDTAPGAKP